MITSARLHLAIGQIDAASAAHERLPPGFRANLVAAWIATMSRDWSSADELEAELDVMAVTEPERFDVLLWRLRTVTTRARLRPRSSVVERLLITQPLPRPADTARHRLVDELSNRELVVLRYMATSMTNQEIADARYLSVNTVKTHIKHVLRKLHATSRLEATRRAHELHYL